VRIAISSKGQITVPIQIREALGLIAKKKFPYPNSLETMEVLLGAGEPGDAITP